MTTSTAIRITLPFPPSINGYWRAIVRGKRPAQILSERGREYRGSAILAAKLSGFAGAKLSGRLGVLVHLTPPDRRQRDLDNYAKSILDAMTHAQVWLDDSQVDDLRIVRCAPEKPGKAVVEIWEIEE